MAEYDPPFPLNPGEQIIRQGEVLYLRSTFTAIGYNPMPGIISLSNQRLMWESTSRRQQLGMTYAPVGFALSRITGMTLIPMKVQFSDRLVMRIEFDNGGKEYFVFASDPDSWQGAIQQAKAQAPELVHTTPPTTRPGVEGARTRSWLFLAALIVGIPLVCGAICLVLAAIGSVLP